MRLCLELFVESVPVTTNLYTCVLMFDTVRYQPDGYSVFRKGGVQITLQAWSHLPDDHSLQSHGHERVGLGVKIVIEVDDLDALYAHVKWPIADPLAERPWVSRDFRGIYPNGCYVSMSLCQPLQPMICVTPIKSNSAQTFS